MQKFPGLCVLTPQHLLKHFHISDKNVFNNAPVVEMDECLLCTNTNSRTTTQYFGPHYTLKHLFLQRVCQNCNDYLCSNITTNHNYEVLLNEDEKFLRQVQRQVAGKLGIDYTPFEAMPYSSLTFIHSDIKDQMQAYKKHRVMSVKSSSITPQKRKSGEEQDVTVHDDDHSEEGDTQTPEPFENNEDSSKTNHIAEVAAFELTKENRERVQIKLKKLSEFGPDGCLSNEVKAILKWFEQCNKSDTLADTEELLDDMIKKNEAEIEWNRVNYLYSYVQNMMTKCFLCPPIVGFKNKEKLGLSRHDILILCKTAITNTEEFHKCSFDTLICNVKAYDST